ncbi:AsmA family protein [Sedimentitalea xiamensis]|uniref:AsmA-like C-terminal region-containing protein n=1 Tax=Sedimentitalea xiamensis TaxID=3050037 RepID=UPI0025406764|nr:AsmA-like C-terminal region-containing protein [Sedimentitalea xiamensis]
MTDLLGQTVAIEGDVRLLFAPRLAVVATDLRLPAQDFPDLDLAKLDFSRFSISPRHLLSGGIHLPEIEARGLDVLLLRGEDGSTTWVEAGRNVTKDSSDVSLSGQPDIIAFLGEREIAFEDMRVHAENRLTGFEFDFDLESLAIDQVVSGEAVTAQVRSGGTINGRPIAFSGDFPNGAPFAARGHMGALTFAVEGQRPPAAPRGDFDGRLSLQTPDLQDLLDLLRLDGEIKGGAEAKAAVTRRSRHIDLDEIDLRARGEGGATVRLTGRFADVRSARDFDLSLLVDLVGDKTPLPPAIFLKDMRVETAEIRVLARGGDIEVDRFALRTNAFDEEIRDIGPFRVATVTRSEDGQLKLDGVTLSIGPRDAPYLLARGSIGNLLTFGDYRLSGELDLPADRVLLTLRPEDAARFGRLTGQMRLLESNGEPNLQLFELRSQDTDLWSAEFQVESADLEDLDRLTLRASIQTRDGRSLLEALRLEPVDIGRMGYDVTATRQANHVDTRAVLTAGQSVIETGMSLRIPGSGPVLRGTIRSDDVRIEDVRSTILALIQLARVKSVYIDSRTDALAGPDDGFQPLVLPSESEAGPPEEDLSEFQPLVLPQPDLAPDTPEDLSDFQPLVLSDGPADLAIADILDPEQFARLIDAEIDIDIARIRGQAGLSRLKSQAEMKSGKLRLGPVRLAYGKGFVDMTATMDAIGAPHRLRVTGRTDGWDFGEILMAGGVDLGAGGTINGRFDLTGRNASAEAFLRSMSGKATIDMTNGHISTGLIELAGLGVLPWLFSQERQRGYADIVCLKADLDIANGRIETRQSVLETRRVQLVGSGTIDVRNDRILFSAEPRPVAQPLSRSAWPFVVSGSLRSPKISVAQRKSRRALVPLAIPDARKPCVPDISQLQQMDGPDTARPR